MTSGAEPQRATGIAAGFSRRALAAALSGAVYAAAEPGVGLWPLVAICLAPLMLALRKRSALERAALGWIMGTVGAAGTVGPTLFFAARSFFELDVATSVGLAVAVGQIFGGLPVALFGWLAGSGLRESPVLVCLRLAAAWGSTEVLRAHLLTGLPWAFLAHALVGVPELLRFASLAGTFGVSFAIAALNAAVAGTLSGPARPRAFALAVGIVVCAVIGARWPDGGEEPGESRLRARLVQGDLPDRWRSDPRLLSEGIDRLLELSRDPGSRPDLVLWPENAVSFVLPTNARRIEALAAELEPIAPYLVLGAPRVSPQAPTRFRNSVLLVRAGRGVTGAHDKVHLVPFAEGLPEWLRWTGLPSPPYEAAPHPRVLRAGRTILGPLICYEVIFPEIARELVTDGAEVLVNLSNDVWIGGAAGREQHLAAAILRAVELHRPVLRVTQTGITAAIDARGHVIRRLPPDTPQAMTVQVAPQRDRTLYSRTGDLAGWLWVATSLAWMLRDALAARRRAGTEPRT